MNILDKLEKRKNRELKIVALTIIIGIVLLVLVAFIRGGETSIEESFDIAENFVKISSTFRFDGIEDSLTIVDYEILDCSYCYSLTFFYDSEHPGYGDRTGKVLAQKITEHKIKIIVKRGIVREAIVDGKYDELRRQFV